MTDSKFWWRLRFLWLVYIIKVSLGLGVVTSFAVTLITVMFTGIPTLNSESLHALWQVASFWFYIAWSFAFLVALVLSFKQLFNHTLSGYILVMLDCETKEPKEDVFLQDVLPLWRKFLFLIIWTFVLLAGLFVGLLGFELQSFGGYKIFIVIIVSGLVLLKPLLLMTRNVRIRRS